MSNEDLVNGSVPNFGYQVRISQSAFTPRLISQQMWFETPEASELLHKNVSCGSCPD